MSQTAKTILLTALSRQLENLGEGVLSMLFDWIDGTDAHPDPEREILRRAAADASKAASKETLAATLERLQHVKRP